MCLAAVLSIAVCNQLVCESLGSDSIRHPMTDRGAQLVLHEDELPRQLVRGRLRGQAGAAQAECHVHGSNTPTDIIFFIFGD